MWRFLLTRRSSQLVEDQPSAADVECDSATFSALLVGNLEASQLRSKIRLLLSNNCVLDKLASLFPPALFWQSQLDSLRF
jgi:hypothetical protein